MKMFNVGLVGTGYISEFHLAGLRRLQNVQIVGACDVDPARAAAFSQESKLPTFGSMQELRDAGADVLHILTPPNTHADLTVQALELGCHAFVEKPLATDVADCERIARAETETNKKVCVGHSLMFDPQVHKALQAVRNGAVGKVVSVDIFRSSVYPPYAGGSMPPQYRSAGYPFRDLGVHAFYILEAFLGPIEHVDAQWSSLGGDPNLAYDEWRSQVRCREGTGQVHLSWNVRPMQSQIIIQGTRGVMRVDLFLMFQSRRGSTPLPKSVERLVNATTDSLKPLADTARGVIGFIRGKVLPYHGLQSLIAAFYESLAAGDDVPVSTADATRVVKWVETVAQAADRDHARKIATLTVSDRVPVLVTGASGALGREVVRRLRSEGVYVRQLVRRCPTKIETGTEIVVGDLGDPEAVDRAVRGARAVIHAGAAMKGGWIEHECGTVTGTRNVLEACRKHGVEKLVHISSLSVIDWAGQPHGEVTESTPFEPQAEARGHYTRAKLAAERLVSEYCSTHQIPAVILRPGQIFGGSIPLLTPAVARKMGSRWLILGNGHVRLPLVYMDDVVDAIVLAMNGPLCKGEIIQLVDSFSPTQNQVLAQACGRSACVLRIPRPVVFSLGKMSELAFAVLKRSSPLSAYRLRSALAIRSFRSENAETLLGWTPRVGAKAGMRRAIGKVEAPQVESATDVSEIEDEELVPLA